MENCSSCGNTEEFACVQCQKSYCTNCAITKHLSESLNSHILNFRCEECEQEAAVKFCDNCDQHLCEACDTRIHNKGKRAQHSKKLLSETVSLKNVGNLAFITSDFFKEQLCTVNGLETSKKNFLDLVKDLNNDSSKECHNKTKISLILIESQLHEVQEDTKLFYDTINEIKPENIVVLKDYSEVKQTLDLNKEKIDLTANSERSSAIAFVLKYLDEVETIHLYDTVRNESLAQYLNAALGQNTKPIFLNFDLVDKQSLKSTPFIQPTNLGDDDDSVHSPMIDSTNAEEITYNEPIFKEKVLEGLIPFTNNSSFGVFEEGQRARQSSSYFTDDSKENLHPNQLSFFSFNDSVDAIKPKSTNSSFYTPNKSTIISPSQPLKQVEIQGSIKIGDRLQQELMGFATKGELLILKETLVKRLQVVFQLKSLLEIENMLVEAENKKIIHMTIRKFLQDSPYYYIGMLLNVLTMDSLVWIIRSIKNDLMTPTEKLVLSRIKECYGLKIEQNHWKSILSVISSKSNFLGGNMSRKLIANACPLYIKQILDPVTNMETNAIYLTNEEWVPEDQGFVDDRSQEWMTFWSFIEDFFKDEPQFFQEIKEKPQMAGELIKGQRWNNSVESSMNRSTSDHEKSFKVSDDVKAIPGGRYGCAQFIKYCGPENLKVLSVGRLTLLVQEAINKGILRYQRTLLVKNTANDSMANLSNKSDFENEVLHSLNAERKAKLISMVREALLEILMENPDGISLAQIPFYLKRKLKFPVDFQELGYPKLKNFLSTLKNLVIIQSAGTNHTFVKLKGPLPRQNNQQSFLSKNIYPKRRIGDVDNLGFGPNQPFKSNEASFNGLKRFNNNMTPNNNFDNSFGRVMETIDLILKQTPNGIPIQDLQRELCHQVGVNINFKAFECESFYEFLASYADHLVNIGAKKNEFIVYRKTSHFWLKGQQQNPMPFPVKHEASANPIRGGALSFEEAGSFGESTHFSQGFNHNGSTTDMRFRNSGMFSNNRFPRNQAASFSHPMDVSSLSTSYSSHNVHNRTTNENFLDNSHLLNINPIFYAGADSNENATTSGKTLPVKYNNINVSTWNLNFNYNNNMNGDMPKQVNNSSWQPDARNFRRESNQLQATQAQEDSHLEENLKYIEDLLQEGDEKMQLSASCPQNTNNYGMGRFYTPNPIMHYQAMANNRG